jgi:hypothetical protein
MYSTGTGTGAHHDICILEIYSLEYFRYFVDVWWRGGATMPKLWMRAC